MITIIAAMTRSRVIGKNNSIPWHIPEDFQHFKNTTLNQTIIMGRKTFESMGKPLPLRNNIVISSSMPEAKGVVVCKTPEEALAKAASLKKGIFIIGGAQIYNAFMPLANKMILSIIKKDYDGDTFFPNFSEDDWIIESRDNRKDFEIISYRRQP